MSAATDYLETEWIKYAFTATAMGTRPTAWYVALHTGDPGETGASNEVTDSGYARQSATFTQTVGEVVTSNSQTFPAIVDGSITISYFSVWDAVSSGNCLMKGPLDLAKNFGIGDVPSFGTGELVLNVD